MKKKELEALRRIRNSNIGQRAYFVLLCGECKSAPKIAKQTGYNEHTVRGWLSAYKKKGVEGLKGVLPPGRPSEKGKAIEENIDEVVSKSPIEVGYIEESWTANLLAHYFSEKGINAGVTTIKRALKKKGWRYKRFAKTLPQNIPSAESKQKRVKEIIDAIKVDMENKPVEIFSCDESHFSNEPYVQRGWCRLGEKKTLYP